MTCDIDLVISKVKISKMFNPNEKKKKKFFFFFFFFFFFLTNELESNKNSMFTDEMFSKFLDILNKFGKSIKAFCFLKIERTNIPLS